MTQLPRAVVEDLLPLYVEGELSAETRMLVEQSLPRYPDLASYANTGGSSMPLAIPLRDPEMELRTVRRTHAALAMQRWLFGLAMGFTAIGLSMSASIRADGVHNFHLMLQEFPLPFGGFLMLGVLMWLLYIRTRRGQGS